MYRPWHLPNLVFGYVIIYGEMLWRVEINLVYERFYKIRRKFLYVHISNAFVFSGSREILYENDEDEETTVV